MNRKTTKLPSGLIFPGTESVTTDPPPSEKKDGQHAEKQVTIKSPTTPAEDEPHSPGRSPQKGPNDLQGSNKTSPESERMEQLLNGYTEELSKSTAQALDMFNSLNKSIEGLMVRVEFTNDVLREIGAVVMRYGEGPSK
ncbi:hypothetical protein E8E11_008662 [Didymella keratinophila]|nr:hypothetical protein E8E11_008662 [Didymella keratinophila]